MKSIDIFVILAIIVWTLCAAFVMFDEYSSTDNNGEVGDE